MHLTPDKDGKNATWKEVDDGPHDGKFLSVLVISGYVMFAVYFIPMIIRPIDFLNNF